MAASAACSPPGRSGALEVDVTVIDRTNHHLFQPLLYQVATGMASRADFTRDVVRPLTERTEPVYVVALAPRGVDVVVSAPGPVLTGFGARANMRIMSGARPREVAVETLEALGRKTTVRPGFLAKALEAALAVLPRGGRVCVMSRVMDGMTAHQQG